ncbi:MAG: hypothetical protein J6O60_09835 [Lachnospiraceae bacterium]|nr:hypothetical protein [Lachnospiraceae bacterium]
MRRVVNTECTTERVADGGIAARLLIDEWAHEGGENDFASVKSILIECD